MPAHFLAFLGGSALINLVTTALSVAVGWHIYEHSGNPMDLAIVGLMQIIPTFLFFFASGWIVDSFSRKNLLILCAIAEALVMAALALVMLAGELNLAFVFGLLFCHGSIRAIYFPATQAIVPNLVPESTIAAGHCAWFDCRQCRHDWRTGYGWRSDLASRPACLWCCLIAGGSGRHLFFCYRGWHGCRWRRATGRLLLAGSPMCGPIQLCWAQLALICSLSWLAALSHYCRSMRRTFSRSVPMRLAFCAPCRHLARWWVGVVLSSLPPMRHCGQRLFLALAVFSGAIVLFALSTNFWLSMVALFVYGAADMISVNIRMTLVQTATPDHLRGRVSAVNSIFIASSNEMGDVRAGGAAAFFGPVATACAGGFMALGVVFIGFLAFPRLRRLDRLADAAPSAASEANEGRYKSS